MQTKFGEMLLRETQGNQLSYDFPEKRVGDSGKNTKDESQGGNIQAGGGEILYIGARFRTISPRTKKRGKKKRITPSMRKKKKEASIILD